MSLDENDEFKKSQEEAYEVLRKNLRDSRSYWIEKLKELYPEHEESECIET